MILILIVSISYDITQHLPIFNIIYVEVPPTSKIVKINSEQQQTPDRLTALCGETTTDVQQATAASALSATTHTLSSYTAIQPFPIAKNT